MLNVCIFHIRRQINRLRALIFHSRFYQKKGKNDKKLSFQISWYQQFPWLHYCPQRKGVLCFSCMKASEKNLLSLVTKRDDAFSSIGFTNWKNAIQRFKIHEQSTAHVLSQLSTHRQSKQGSRPVGPIRGWDYAVDAIYSALSVLTHREFEQGFASRVSHAEWYAQSSRENTS